MSYGQREAGSLLIAIREKRRLWDMVQTTTASSKPPGLFWARRCTKCGMISTNRPRLRPALARMLH